MKMTFDEKLKQALAEVSEQRLNERYTDVKKHRFSLSYRISKRKTLKQLKKRENEISAHPLNVPKPRKIRAALMAAVISAIILGVGTYAVTNIIGRFNFNRKPEYSRLNIAAENSDRTYIEDYYGLPEEDGWEIDYYFADEESSMIAYKEKDGMLITVCQNTVEGGNNYHIDTENTMPQAVTLYEEDDGFYIEHQFGGVSLYYIYDGYLFSISGNIDKNEALNLAYSLKKINFEKNL